MTDLELKREVTDTLKMNNVAVHKVKVKAREGYVYLEGEVEHPSQRNLIGKILMQRYIRGMLGICNLITIKNHNENAVCK